MNRNQIKGAIKDALGRVQEHAGKAMGSSEQEARGVARQGQGRLQKAYGNLKEALKKSRHS